MEALLTLEHRFFEWTYIGDRKWLEDTLHDAFVECGRSGQLYGKAETIDALLACGSDRDIRMQDAVCEPLSKDCALVHYVTKSEGALWYRTSIWVREGRWRLRYHQASRLRELPVREEGR